MAQQYEVKKGDTLSAIARKYGVSISQISGYRSGDPNKIYPGEKLTIGEATPELGGLGGTLKTGGGVEVVAEKTLPTLPMDKLSMFGEVLKLVTNRAAQEAKASGAAALPEGMLKPEQVSGGTFADILNFVSTQKTQGIKDIYTATTDLLESSKKTAETQLNTLISQKALPQLNDEQLARLSSMSGMDFEYLVGIKKTQEEEAKKPKSFSIVEEGGRKIRLGFDDMGNIVSRTDIGEVETKEILAPKTLEDLAKLGYTRRGATDGGWDFFKDGMPITAEQISQETGISLIPLLEGSGNPEDIKKVKQLKGTSGSSPEADFYDSL